MVYISTKDNVITNLDLRRSTCCTKVLDPPGHGHVGDQPGRRSPRNIELKPCQQNDAAVTDTDRDDIDINRAANLRIVKVTNPGDIDQNFDF